ncbi:GNAT family N-acetyltransferase [Paenibacillus polymyxa]|uniref:GNAT family N-acetyltransferase n=1 Tax=Paenibacillus polymyxa TaxID=1406 RepID=UPI0025B7240E|nr:GNAT family N-acetyltransferase [Paenibacillus polymyxa]MDN4086238.1 GNAT family N-acetyltransferase [Paenibacillus polymyxa]MDN4088533.1 GNAT family N-acetyltransferase [Paenibacillus polymyxa]MDN4107984.1 GNAT family N-acetyltransferase [Paenibacillus polymyxa]
MELKLVPVSPEDKSTLINLYELYEYDFSKYTGRDVDRNGKFEVNIDYYWEGDERWNPFFIEVADTIVGFIVVLFENMDTDPDPTHVIYDFMILQKYRRSGMGRKAAIMAFNMYKANWLVSQMAENITAITFWRSVINEFKKGNYTERYREERKKYIQEFTTKI